MKQVKLQEQPGLTPAEAQVIYELAESIKELQEKTQHRSVELEQDRFKNFNLFDAETAKPFDIIIGILLDYKHDLEKLEIFQKLSDSESPC